MPTQQTTREGMSYYGFARNDQGQCEQVLVTFPGNKMAQAWTGVIYGNGKKDWKAAWREADADVARLNR